MIKHIFFDFDGVLAESVNIKTESFRKLYLSYGNVFADRVVEHHLANGGVSRFEKFKIYHSWLGIDISKEQMEHLVNKFSELVLKGVISSTEVKGASEFLNNQYKNFNFWIISGTPTNEMKLIVKARKLEHFFKGVYGSPQKKNEWTEFIIKSNNLDRSEILFIGDAISDYEASSFSNICFVLRETDDNIELFKNYLGIRVRDLSNFLETVKSI